MNNNIKYSSNKTFFGVLITLILLNVIASVSENSLLLVYTKPLLIPAFLICYFIENNRLKLILSTILFFFFLGDISALVFSQENTVKIFSMVYVLGYLCLTGFVIAKFKKMSLDALVAVYLFTILMINSYFLYVLYTLLKAVTPDQTEVVLFVVKSVSLLILAFVAFALYLSSETTKSIILLMSSLCFVFSNVLYYVSYYYIYDWSFVMLDRALNVLAIFFLLRYFVETDKTKVQAFPRSKRSPNNIMIKQL